MSWRIRGSYFESCNCDAICPCRRIDGVSGGRSTHGECLGLLSWLIEEGDADGVDLGGQPVALATRYSDDEEGSPWTWILYLDQGTSGDQRDALEAIYAGRLGGEHVDEPAVGRLVRALPDVLRVLLGRVVLAEGGLDPTLGFRRVARLDGIFRNEGDARTRALRRDGCSKAGSAASDHEHVEFDRGGHETPTIPASD